MSDNPILGIKEQQRRRRRIHRMKSAILWFLVLWILATVVACTVLFINVFSLNQKLNTIYDIIAAASGNVVMSEADFADLTGETFSEGDVTIQYNIPEDEPEEDDMKRVYLTFDDGPSENTDEILDVLDRYEIKATFFVVGKTDEHSKQMYQRIVDEGHTLALHSYTHKYNTIYSSLDAYQQDLDQLSDLIYDVTGVRSHYMRFPGGSSNQVSDIDMKEFIKLVTQQGYQYYDWNVVSGDATSRKYTAEDLEKNVLDGVHNYRTSIVLMHDATNKTSTVEALPVIIETLKKEGYTMLPIDENTKLIQHVSVESVVNE